MRSHKTACLSESCTAPSNGVFEVLHQVLGSLSPPQKGAHTFVPKLSLAGEGQRGRQQALSSLPTWPPEQPAQHVQFCWQGFTRLTTIHGERHPTSMRQVGMPQCTNHEERFEDFLYGLWSSKPRHSLLVSGP